MQLINKKHSFVGECFLFLLKTALKHLLNKKPSDIITKKITKRKGTYENFYDKTCYDCTFYGIDFCCNNVY